MQELSTSFSRRRHILNLWRLLTRVEDPQMLCKLCAQVNRFVKGNRTHNETKMV